MRDMSYTDIMLFITKVHKTSVMSILQEVHVRPKGTEY
jgi:hypothetical protein